MSSVPGNLGGAGRDHPTDQVRLRVENLQVCLSGSTSDVVDEVSFSVASGQLLGLVGESGSGKTTVAHALLAYARRGLSITSGHVILDGVDLLRLTPRELRGVRGARVAYVPQDPASALHPGLRIGRQLMDALRAHPNKTVDSKLRIAEVMTEANLDSSPEMLRRYPHQLSGGQQQRVAIAMAFACRPSLIVLDEPTTGLDVSTQRHVLNTVKRLCQAYGVAAVYVSHDLAVVGELVDHVAVMYAGRVVEIGSSRELFRTPVHPYTRGLLAAIPSPERAQLLVGIPGQPPTPNGRPNGCPFEPRCPSRLPECRSSFPVVDLPRRMVRCTRALELASIPKDLDSVQIPARPEGRAGTLSIRGLIASYGHTTVLHGVDLDLASQECLAVVGESGSGKTTLARCVVGLHGAWTGSVDFQGQEIRPGIQGRSAETLRRVRYVFQNPYASLNPRRTIGQNLLQPLQHFSRLSPAENEKKILRALDDVSLGDTFLNSFPHQLSGGQRQRAAIARALIVEPDLLVCDEVTSALDVSVQAMIVEMLRRLQAERQLSMLFITHNLALVRSIAQSCVVLANGRVVEAGPVADVLDRPQDPYTVGLMRDVPKLVDAL